MGTRPEDSHIPSSWFWRQLSCWVKDVILKVWLEIMTVSEPANHVKIWERDFSKKKWNFAYYSDIFGLFSFFLEIISRPHNNLSQKLQAQILAQALTLIFQKPSPWSLEFDEWHRVPSLLPLVAKCFAGSIAYQLCALGNTPNLSKFFS